MANEKNTSEFKTEYFGRVESGALIFDVLAHWNYVDVHIVSRGGMGHGDEALHMSINRERAREIAQMLLKAADEADRRDAVIAAEREAQKGMAAAVGQT
jgi:hypothetical protein